MNMKRNISLLTMMVISLLSTQFNLTTARSTHSKNSLTKITSKQTRAWPHQQQQQPADSLASLGDVIEELELEAEEKAAERESDGAAAAALDEVGRESAESLNPKPAVATATKQWLDLEGVPPPRVSTKLHTDVTLECQAVGSPPPMIYWMKNGKPIDNALAYSSEEFFNQVDGQSSSGLAGSEGKGFVMAKTKSKLPIRCILPDDEAQYTCVAENQGREVSASTLLVIEEDDTMGTGDKRPECQLRMANFGFHKKGKRIPASILISEVLHMESIGNDVVLPCRGAGRPRPKISWVDAEGQRIVSGKKFQVSSNGNLLIRNLSWNEMGEYTCLAENKLGSDLASTFVYPLMTEEDR